MPPVLTSLQSKVPILQLCVRRQTAMGIQQCRRRVQWAARHQKNVKSKRGEKTIGMGKAQQDPCMEISSLHILLQVRKNDHNSLFLYENLWIWERGKMREIRIYDSGFWFYTCMQAPGKLYCCFLTLPQMETKYFSPSSSLLFSILREITTFCINVAYWDVQFGEDVPFFLPPLWFFHLWILTVSVFAPFPQVSLQFMCICCPRTHTAFRKLIISKWFFPPFLCGEKKVIFQVAADRSVGTSGSLHFARFSEPLDKS